MIAVDPDGRTISVEDDTALRNAIIESIRRPSGRAEIEPAALDKHFHTNVREGKLGPLDESGARTSQAAKATLVRKHKLPAADITFGETTFTVRRSGGTTQTVGADIVIDTTAVRLGHPVNKQGVATVVHEFHHEEAGRNGRDPALGDKPDAASGPAARYGSAAAAERPILSRKAAEKLLLKWLKMGQNRK